MGEIRENVGRNHHIDTATMWMAGGGIRPGLNLGVTDEFGFAPIEDRVHIHDIQATLFASAWPRSQKAYVSVSGS